MLDTIIIGAGAAGLAAGRKLLDAGQKILILEARNRIGGRIWTDAFFANYPIEYGAEFIHGDNVVTHELLRTFKIRPIPAPRKPGLWFSHSCQASAKPLKDLSIEDQKLIGSILADEADLLKWLSAVPAGSDVSLADYMRSKGHTSSTALAAADVILAQTRCANLDRVSARDVAQEIARDRAGLGEYRVEQGYSAFLDCLASGLPLRLNTAVDSVRLVSNFLNSDSSSTPVSSGSQVEVVAGDSRLLARCCIVTVPVALLQKQPLIGKSDQNQNQHNGIRFEPDLSLAKQAALAMFRVEPATKLIYAFRPPAISSIHTSSSEEQALPALWRKDLVYMAVGTGETARWWTPAYGRGGPTVPCLTCYATADRAQLLDSLPEDGALALGLAQASALLEPPGRTSQEDADQEPNESNWLARHCVASKRVSWAADPWAGGGYASVSPGPGAGRAREDLAAKEWGGALLWAGEATAFESNPQTVHGALDSGFRAADEALEHAAAAAVAAAGGEGLPDYGAAEDACGCGSRGAA